VGLEKSRWRIGGGALESDVAGRRSPRCVKCGGENIRTLEGGKVREMIAGTAKD